MYLKFPNVVDADMAMRQQYETAFGIFNHEGPDSPEVPWPLMAISPKESPTLVDPLEFRLDQYAENRVGDIFKIPFDQLIQFPRRDFLMVMASSKRHAAKLDAAGSTAMRDLEKQLSQLGVRQNNQS